MMTGKGGAMGLAFRGGWIGLLCGLASQAFAQGIALRPEPVIRQLMIKLRPMPTQTGERVARSSDLLARMRTSSGFELSFQRAVSVTDTYVYALPRSLSVVDARKVAALLQAGDSRIEAAELDYPVYPEQVPNDPLYSQQWHYQTGPAGIHLPEAWDLTTGAASIFVAVLDTGILPHPDLVGRYQGGYDFITSAATAGDGDGRDADPTDVGDSTTAGECSAGSSASSSTWHGTHVSGTIGAASNNAVGVAGINWVSKVIPIRVLGKCGGSTSDLVDGIRWAAGLSVSGVPDNPSPARVLNLSLGGSGTCGGTLQAAISEVIAAGSAVVVAAGNANLNLDSNDYVPAGCSGVIAVAAVGPTGKRAYYSNYGALVKVAAPGGDQTSSNSDGVYSTSDSGTTTAAGSTYKFLQGTSMATPHVAGVLSLMFSFKPSLNPAEALAALQASATAFPTGTGDDCTPQTCGTGIINAAAAIRLASPVRMSVQPSTESGGGCVTSAVAGTPGAHSTSSPLAFFSSAWFWAVALFGWCRFRRSPGRRAALGWIAFAALAGATRAEAAFDDDPTAGPRLRVGVEKRQIHDSRLDAFITPDNSASTWSDFNGASRLSDLKSVVLEFDFIRSGALRFGIFGRYLLTTSIDQSATRISSSKIDTFQTRLSGYSAGPHLGIELPISAAFYLSFGAEIAGGPIKLQQSLVSTTETNRLDSSAIGLEEGARLALGYFVTGSISLEASVGYSRQLSNYLVADAATGTVYETIVAGNRMQVQGKDFKLDLSGSVVGVSLSLWF